MKIKLTKTIYKNGDYSITTDCDHIPFVKVVEEYEQDVEVDETKWEKKNKNNENRKVYKG